MPLNLTNVFTALGRVGHELYVINSAQDDQAEAFDDLVSLAYINPAWTAPLASSYDPGIRGETGVMSVWQQTAVTVLQNLVAAENPTYGVSLPMALFFLNQEMVTQGASVQSYTVGQVTTPDALNVGSGNLVIVLTRSDGLLFQNVVAEQGTILITADSFTGGATAGLEPWQYIGQPDLSSLGTDTAVGQWDWDWPQGSGVTTSGQCVAANYYANATGNILTNGDWETWTAGSSAPPDYWNAVVGTFGSTMLRNSAQQLGGTYCIEFVAGATLNELTQTFGTGEISGTDAGTSADVVAFRTFVVNLWLKRAGVISGGVLTVSLVDDTDTVINDEAGTPNSGTVTLSTVTASYVAHAFTFRLPVQTPDTVRLKIKITTALAGANLYMDWVAMAQPTNLYPGGANAVLFSNPADPFEAAPDPDGYTIVFSNNYGGSNYLASWQSLVLRLFGTPGLILPYSGSPTIADTLITTP